MKQNIKPITKQLLISAIILALVTALSFGIRQVRFSAYRASSSQPSPSALPPETKDQTQPKQPLYTDAESDYYPEDSYTTYIENDPQDIEESFWDEQAPSDDYSKENTDSVKYDKAVSGIKSFKGGYAKPGGKNGLQKISLSDNENIYITEKGEAWYVSKEPDGSITKMQVQVDDRDDATVVSGENYVKYGGSQSPRRISVGENEDLYLTEEGQVWYVSEEADGSTTKAQLEEDIDGELTIVDDGKDD